MREMTSDGAESHGCRCDDVLRALWAKDPESGGPPFAPTPHLLDTAAAIEALWRAWLRPGLRDLIVNAVAPDDEALAVRSMRLMAGLHDVGKVNPLFQFQSHDRTNLAWRCEHTERLAPLGLEPADQGTVVASRIYREGALPGHGFSVARRHEYVGAFHLLGRQHFKGDLCAQTQWVQTAVSGHHGLWRVPESPIEFHSRNDHALVDACMRGGWGDVMGHQQSLIEDALGMRLVDVPPMKGPKAGPALILASGLLILADWVASNDAFIESGKSLIRDGLDPVADPAGWYAARSEAMPSQVAATVGELQPLEGAEALILGSKPPRPLQQAALTLGRADGLWLVAVPTGEGKTKAAQLRHVQRPDERMIFALPTTATTDAMAATLRLDFHQTGNPVVLSHQYASFSQSEGQADTHLYADSWFTTSVRRLLAPLAVMTCDQVLSAALTQRSTHLRLLAVANHHVVFDEVHTFDAYQRELLAELLAWLGATNSRVTLLSASIPHEDAVAYRDAYAHGATRDRRRKLTLPYVSAYPRHSLLTFGDDGSPVADSDLEPLPLSTIVQPARFYTVATTDLEDTRADWTLQQAAAHPRCHVAVVCNRVDSAIGTARAVAGSLPATHDLLVLHSRMTRTQRCAVEAQLRERLGPPPDMPNPDASPQTLAAYEAALATHQAIRPTVVVATQIIEASLDIDFDIMGSDLAPSPSLVQRIGRLWRFRDDVQRRRRHGANGPTREVAVFVSTNDDGSWSVQGAMPYEPAEMRKVLALITTRPVLRIPDDVQSFVDDGRVTFSDLVDPENAVWAQEVERYYGAQMRRMGVAEGSKAELLRTVIAPSTLAYKYLTALTRLPDDEDAMRTRFIDMPSSTFILFDSRQSRSPHVAAGPVPADIRTASGSRIRDWQGATVPASGRHRDDLLALHEATLRDVGIDEWKPRAAVLKRQFPVDLARRDRVARDRASLSPMGDFDDVLGWC